jgi:hypothetical protein
VKVTVGGCDARGVRVDKIHALTPGEFTIYSSDGEVMVQWADDYDATEQQEKLRGISDLRAELSVLVAKTKDSNSYQRKIAGGIFTCLRGNESGARQILEGVKTVVLNDLAATQRFQYMLWIAGWFILDLSILFLMSDYIYRFVRPSDNLWLAGKGG